MKQIKTYINEKLHLGQSTNIHAYHPKTKAELLKLLDKLIKERGYDGDFNDIDTSEITDMSMLFTFARINFNGDISEWDVSNVKDMKFMFCDAQFNKDISQWDVSQVENMYNMFYNSKFDGDISEWNVDNVNDMRNMFDASPLAKNPPKWYKYSEN